MLRVCIVEEVRFWRGSLAVGSRGVYLLLLLLLSFVAGRQKQCLVVRLLDCSTGVFISLNIAYQTSCGTRLLVSKDTRETNYDTFQQGGESKSQRFIDIHTPALSSTQRTTDYKFEQLGDRYEH